MIELQIQATLPSLNTFVKNHWAQYHRQRKEWGQLVMVAKVQAHVRGDPKYSRVRLEIERHSARPIYDEDNLQAGRKFLCDALVQNGLISDDSTDVITECRVTQRKTTKAEAKTVVRIYPAPAPPTDQ